MTTDELIAAAEGLVKELQGRINGGGMDLQEAEAKILEMVNWIGDAMVQEVVTGLDEPTSANRITVGGEVAVFERVRNLRFINRFGEEVVRRRRGYRYRDRDGGVSPLDVKLGIDGCFGFSPLMTFLICMLGAEASCVSVSRKRFLWHIGKVQAVRYHGISISLKVPEDVFALRAEWCGCLVSLTKEREGLLRTQSVCAKIEHAPPIERAIRRQVKSPESRHRFTIGTGLEDFRIDCAFRCKSRFKYDKVLLCSFVEHL